LLETNYKILKILEANPNATQREIAAELGVSLGKTNYCLKAVLEKGWIKMQNFKNSQNKLAYAYALTPKGLKEKAKITQRFLQQKIEEYDVLKKEIQSLKKEVKMQSTNNK